MNADDIRQECKRNCEQFSSQVNGSQLLMLAQYGALMEIAAQLAELNARLRNKFSLETMD